MVTSGVDWASILLQTLEESPLVLQNTFRKRELRSNSWQCHILACMFSCLAPRIRAEIADWRLGCCGRDDMIEEEEIVQVAFGEAFQAIRQAESFVQSCDGTDASSLIVSTASTGEALTIHVHNLFWSASSLLLATRVALGFPDDRLTALMEQQVHCWSNSIARYIGLGAELLDLKHVASLAETEINDKIEEHNPFDNARTESPSLAKLLSRRLKWALSRDQLRGNHIETLLRDLKIDPKGLILENRFATGEASHHEAEDNGEEKYAPAMWAGLRVAVKRCPSNELRESAATLLRMRNPFILQLIGWSEAAPADDKSLCYIVVEAVQTDLGSFIEATCQSKGAEREDGLPFPFHVALDMMLQIARGMWYLHRNGIAHKGLRSSKVLLCEGYARLKLCDIGLPSFAQKDNPGYSADVHSFGLLCIEILTGKQLSNGVINSGHDEENDVGARPQGRLVEMLPASTPVLLSDCLIACCDARPQQRPEFGVICGLLRHLKLIVSNPRRLERLLNFSPEDAAKTPTSDSASTTNPISKAAPDEMGLRLQLIDINVHVLQRSTPSEIYPLVAAEAWSGAAQMSLKALEALSAQLLQRLGEQSSKALDGDEDGTSRAASTTTRQVKFVVSNAGTLKASLVVDGCRGLLRSAWSSTSVGMGTLEMWLPHLPSEWKQVQKVGLGVALCLRHVSKTPPNIGFYSPEQGNIDGFYPIYPSNILLNSQLKVALLLDNTLSAWRGLVQWAGVHPQVGDGDNILLSIEAYTTFYFGHLLSSIIKARRHSIPHKSPSSSDRHFEFVLTNLAMRCIQLKCLSMTEVVTILLNDYKPSSRP